MKPTFLLLLTAAFAPAATEVYEIRPVPGTLMELTVEKTGLLSGKKHLFTFTEYRGTLMFDREAPDHSAVTLSVESASALCRDAWLSAKDLRKVQEYAVKDMLAADRYPHITFRSTAIKTIDANRYQAQGNVDGSRHPEARCIGGFIARELGRIARHRRRVDRSVNRFWAQAATAALGTIGTKNEISFRFFIAPAKRDETSSSGE